MSKPSRRKASFSQSPLSHPYSPIHRLATGLQDYLHFPDPYPLYVLMASLVANYASGPPVWLMLIGPPSCGKSELLNSLLSLPGIHEGGAITGVGALLSGSKRKERSVDSTGGLLREVGDRGALIIKEFTSILSLPNETMRGLLAAFREVYDGRWTRPMGSDGGRSEHWEGKLAVLTGCTEAIDHHTALTNDMGERFVFYRYESSDGWSETFKALGNTDTEQTSSHLRDLVVTFADEIGLDWSAPPVLPDLNSHQKQRVIAFAQIASHGRSSVVRDNYTREIIQASVGEYPIRLALAMAQVFKSLLHIGVDESDAWRILRKCSFDSIPGARRSTFMALLTGATGTSQIAESVQVSQTTVRRSLEELKIHNLADRTDQSSWVVSPWAKDKLREAMNGSYMNGAGLK